MTPEEALAFSQTLEGVQAARDYLSAAGRLDAMIALRLARLDEVRSRGERITRMMESMHGSGVGDRVGEAAAELADLETELLADYSALLRRQRAIGETIRRVPDEVQRLVLEMRYLQNISFAAIATRLEYDERQIYRFHERALRHVAVQIALGEAE